MKKRYEVYWACCEKTVSYHPTVESAKRVLDALLKKKPSADVAIYDHEFPKAMV